jgi:hypothetical protein
VYRNDGNRWRQIYALSSASGLPYGSQITGTAERGPVLIGGQCAFLELTTNGAPSCIWNDAPNAEFFGVGTASGALFGLFLSESPHAVRRYDGTDWADVTTLEEGGAATIAASDDFVVVAGGDALVWAGQAGGSFSQMSGVPAGGYAAAWTRGADDITLGDGAGHLAHYDGQRWTVLDTGTVDPILRVWQAPEGTAYFITQSQFGRAKNGQVELLYSHAPLAYPDHTFVDLFGNSENEVFLTVNASQFAAEECGMTFVVWFDGSEFHQF